MSKLATEIRVMALSMQEYRKEANAWYNRTVGLTLALIVLTLVAVLGFLELRTTKAALADCQAGFEVSPFYDTKPTLWEGPAI